MSNDTGLLILAGLVLFGLSEKGGVAAPPSPPPSQAKATEKVSVIQTVKEAVVSKVIKPAKEYIEQRPTTKAVIKTVTTPKIQAAIVKAAPKLTFEERRARDLARGFTASGVSLTKPAQVSGIQNVALKQFTPTAFDPYSGFGKTIAGIVRGK